MDFDERTVILRNVRFIRSLNPARPMKWSVVLEEHTFEYCRLLDLRIVYGVKEQVTSLPKNAISVQINTIEPLLVRSLEKLYPIKEVKVREDGNQIYVTYKSSFDEVKVCKLIKECIKAFDVICKLSEFKPNWSLIHLSNIDNDIFDTLIVVLKRFNNVHPSSQTRLIPYMKEIEHKLEEYKSNSCQKILIVLEKETVGYKNKIVAECRSLDLKPLLVLLPSHYLWIIRQI